MYEEYIGSLLLGMGGFVFFVVLSIAVASLMERRKSFNYRKEITDLYVAAKTRLLAENDKLDLSLELKNYHRWSKKKKTENPEYSLDKSIEDGLIEKVNKPLEKKK